MELKHCTDEELKAELERRENAAKEERSRSRAAKVKKFVENRDILLDLMTHDRNSCSTCDNSGYHREHGVAHCSYCAFKELQIWEEDIQIDFSIRLSKVKD